jgi:hypothetical protein
MILFEQREDVKPSCPHCKKEINSVWFRDLKGDLGRRCLYFCPRRIKPSIQDRMCRFVQRCQARARLTYKKLCPHAYRRSSGLSA